ncbi:hypothetical protein I4F81_008012 [Pyropia yezoensis]|uniref:Uncharacterized protein n=1 Tax=Pyropia yezoensis TaxID=2788 RepID=A0ACC3C668_PYRYE|nr:hypothetical protein I4F81_008012 [Neopyropia yezoensis]
MYLIARASSTGSFDVPCTAETRESDGANLKSARARPHWPASSVHTAPIATPSDSSRSSTPLMAAAAANPLCAGPSSAASNTYRRPRTPTMEPITCRRSWRSYPSHMRVPRSDPPSCVFSLPSMRVCEDCAAAANSGPARVRLVGTWSTAEYLSVLIRSRNVDRSTIENGTRASATKTRRRS